jgi:hypothetical protein
MTDHPNRITLERLSVGDLSDPDRVAAVQHTESCPACRAFLEELEAAQTARLTAMPAERFVALVAERRDRDANLATRRRRRWGFGAVAAVAAAALLLLIPRPEQIRLKGAGVTIHRKRGGEVQVLAGNDTIRAGDALRLVITQAQAGPIAAWMVDARGRVDAWLSDSRQFLAAGEHALPGSVIVESPCVDSWLVVASGAAADEKTAKELRRAVAAGVPAGDAWFPRGTQVRKLRCE